MSNSIYLVSIQEKYKNLVDGQGRFGHGVSMRVYPTSGKVFVFKFLMGFKIFYMGCTNFELNWCSGEVSGFRVEIVGFN